MGFAFRPDTPVLYFRPRAHARWSARRYVLWPAWVYRVVAPEVRERRLNVLQKAALGLCLAGINAPEKVGQRLRLHTDLAQVILFELHQRGLLGATGIPTSKGIDVLEEETLKSGRLVTGHVFQDPWTGGLWSRFVECLDYAEIEMSPAGYPELILGTTGKPRRQRAFMQFPREGALPAAPHAKQILTAVRGHRRALRNVDDGMPWDEEEGGRTPVGDFSIERIALVDDEPAAVFLATYLYLPEGGETDGGWHVCDPFGLGSSRPLWKAIERQLDTSKGLRDTLERLVGQSLAENVEKQRQWTRDLREQGALQVDRALTVNARTLPFYEDLVAMASCHVEVDLLGLGCPEHKFREVLGAGRRAIEAAFATIADKHPATNVWRWVYVQGRPHPDQQYVSGIYAASAKAVGFSELPATFSNVKPNHIKAACRGDAWRLRAAVVAALLAARDDMHHPLRQTAVRDPRFLVTLDEIAGWAGEAAHAGTTRLTQKVVDESAAKVLVAIGLLTGLSDNTSTTPSRGSRT